MKKKIIILILILIFFILLKLLFVKNSNEKNIPKYNSLPINSNIIKSSTDLNSKFNDLYIDNFIDYQVIHAPNKVDREENINLMSKILNKTINKFDAIIGSDVDLNNLSIYDKNINFTFNYKTKGEIGCYLSHLMLLKSLKQSNYSYCLILEDDFKILDNQFHSKLVNIINDIDEDFDLLYLGNQNNNHGKHYKNNIYYFNKYEELWGTHAYIVNIKNINKIYNSILDINTPIDDKFKKLLINNTLKGFIIYPVLIKTSGLPTTIQLPQKFNYLSYIN